MKDYYFQKGNKKSHSYNNFKALSIHSKWITFDIFYFKLFALYLIFSFSKGRK